MSLDWSGPPERYALIGLYGLITMVHVAGLSAHLQADEVLMSVVVAHGIFIAALSATMVWMATIAW